MAHGDIALPRSLKADVPPTLEAICRKAMAVRPGGSLSVGPRTSRRTSRAGWPTSRRKACPSRWRAGSRPGSESTALFCASAESLWSPWPLVAVLAAFGVNAARERAEARRLEADELSRIAEARKQEADRQRDALRHFTTRLTLDRGLALLEGNSRRAGLLWLARSLESAAGQNDPFEPAIRGNLAAWSPLVHRLQGLPRARGAGSGRRLEPDRADRRDRER